jgi:hypothetical protein
VPAAPCATDGRADIPAADPLPLTHGRAKRPRARPLRCELRASLQIRAAPQRLSASATTPFRSAAPRCRCSERLRKLALSCRRSGVLPAQAVPQAQTLAHGCLSAKPATACPQWQGDGRAVRRPRRTTDADRGAAQCTQTDRSPESPVLAVWAHNLLRTTAASSWFAVAGAGRDSSR